MGIEYIKVIRARTQSLHSSFPEASTSATNPTNSADLRKLAEEANALDGGESKASPGIAVSSSSIQASAHRVGAEVGIVPETLQAESTAWTAEGASPLASSGTHATSSTTTATQSVREPSQANDAQEEGEGTVEIERAVNPRARVINLCTPSPTKAPKS